MRRGNLFWGVILIILGVLFFMQAQGWISDVFGWFWPFLLILLGLWVLGGRFLSRWFVGSSESFSVDLQGASKVDIDFDHGAGAVFINGDAPAGMALTGTQAGGMEVKSNLTGGSLGIDIDAGPTFIPFLGPDSGEWRLQITREVPVAIKVDAGASSMDFDMTGVKLTYLGVDMGASSLKVKLPSDAGHTLVDVESGAASVEVTIPAGVAARIRFEQGASSISLDEQRFPAFGGAANLHQSPDFDTAANKVEISLEGGANSVKIL